MEKGFCVEQGKDCPPVLYEYLKYQRVVRCLSPATLSSYYYSNRLFLRYLMRDRRNLSPKLPLNIISIQDVDAELLDGITAWDVCSFLRELEAGTLIHGAGAKFQRRTNAGSRAVLLSQLQSFYKYLFERENLIYRNPLDEIEYPKRSRRLPRYLSMSHANVLVQAAGIGKNKVRDSAIILLFLNTGIRVNELTGLNLNDFKKDRVRVIGKGNRERIVYIGENCRKALRIYIRKRKKTAPAGENALFLGETQKRIQNAAVRRIVKENLAKAGLSQYGYTPHSLRHTTATMMVAAGVNIRVVQEILGHQNIATTAIYTHVESKALKAASEAIPEFG